MNARLTKTISAYSATYYSSLRAWISHSNQRFELPTLKPTPQISIYVLRNLLPSQSNRNYT